MKIHMGEVIHEMAKELGLRAEDIAPHLNRTVGTVYQIYKRPDVDTDTLFALSTLFQRPIAAFFGEAYRQVPPKEEVPNNLSEKCRQIMHENEILKVKLAAKDELLDVYKKLIPQ